MTVRGEEFNPSKPYERYSAERKRRQVTAAQLGYGGVAAAGGAAATGFANAKFAGTRTGQGLIGLGEKKLGRKHPLTPHLQTAKKVGTYAAANKGKMTAGLVGASAIGGAAGVVRDWRRNEEVGISQGLGRTKAGTSYETKQKKVKKRFHPALLGASLADVNWNNPAIKATTTFASKHQKKLAVGGAGATAGAGAVGGTVAVRNRKKEKAKLRTALGKADGTVISAFGVDHGIIEKSDFARTAIQGAKALTRKKDKAGHLKRMEGFGAQHRAKGGALHEEVNRPPVWKPKTRAAWDKGFHG